MHDRAWIEVNQDRLLYNAAKLKRAIAENCKLMAIVKANAYGHGATEIARILEMHGTTEFGVATLAEAIELRESGIQGDILILGYSDPADVGELARYNLIQTVVDHCYAEKLNNVGKKLRVHVKVDTGMHRLGEDSRHENRIKEIYRLPNLTVEGTFTHLAAADDLSREECEFTNGQIAAFFSCITHLRNAGINPGKVHFQSSYGILNYGAVQGDIVRAGIALYGVKSDGKPTRQNLGLKPALSLKSKIASVRLLASGEQAGYGGAFTAEEQTRVAIATIGYGDGIPRELSGGNGHALVSGCRVPIVGRVCMDQLLLDVTNVNGNVESGDTATFIGRDGDEEISAEMVAENCGTITNEILSRLGTRLTRKYIGPLSIFP